MKIKHYRRIEWDDLPRLETPFFAQSRIGCRFTGLLSSRAHEIRGLDEAFRQCRLRFGRLYPPEDQREDVHELLARIEDGEFVLVHEGEWEHPMLSMLRWQTADYFDGFHVPDPNDRLSWRKMPLEGRWVADYRLPMLLRSEVEQWLEKGRRDASLHRGLPERLWWNLWQQGCGQSAPEGDAEDAAPVERVARHRDVDSVVSLNDPDPGFMKAGLFSPHPRPPRMSDKVFEANMCEWACACKDAYGPDGTHQGCVDERIRAAYYDNTDHPRDDSPVWSEVSYHKEDAVMSTGGIFGGSTPVYEKYDMVESRNYPGKPTSWYPRPDTWRLDVVKVGPNGKPEKFYDMKFPGDEPGNDSRWHERKTAYEAIAKKHTGSIRNYETFVVEKKCRNCQKQEQGQPEKASQGESRSLGEQFRDWDRLPEKPPIGSDGSPKPTPPILPLPGLPILI